ncbi:HAD hydrolase family protein, partial [Acinetobacter baumannii]|nr:HAD hydrolase family protein [Acinetobacter baumannii]
GLESVPTYAFGDGPNDLEMFQVADYSVAMGNGIAALKERASFISASNIDGGIVKGLDYFNLI